MAAREGNRTITAKSAPADAAPDVEQRKRPEHQFRLQVDRQTKSSYSTYEAAEAAGLAIKKEHPIVQVSVYDAVQGVKKVIELPE